MTDLTSSQLAQVLREVANVWEPPWPIEKNFHDLLRDKASELERSAQEPKEQASRQTLHEFQHWPHNEFCTVCGERQNSEKHIMHAEAPAEGGDGERAHATRDDINFIRRLVADGRHGAALDAIDVLLERSAQAGGDAGPERNCIVTTNNGHPITVQTGPINYNEVGPGAGASSQQEGDGGQVGPEATRVMGSRVAPGPSPSTPATEEQHPLAIFLEMMAGRQLDGSGIARDLRKADSELNRLHAIVSQRKAPDGLAGALLSCADDPAIDHGTALICRNAADALDQKDGEIERLNLWTSASFKQSELWGGEAGKQSERAKTAEAQLAAAVKVISELKEIGPPGDPIRAPSDQEKFDIWDDGYCEAWRRAGDMARNYFQQKEPKP